MQENERVVLIISTLLVLFIVVALIILFTVFQKKKNSLVEEQKEAKKRFETEIAETQIEIREETLRNISWELHDNIGQLLTLAKIQLQNATKENINDVSISDVPETEMNEMSISDEQNFQSETINSLEKEDPWLKQKEQKN